MSRLHYDWFGPLHRLQTEPQPYPWRRLSAVIAHAEWFISHWADYAEHVGMQPVHLLRNDTEQPTQRGLAWRWNDCMDVLCFPRRRHLVAEANGVAPTLFVYEFGRDGRTNMVLGATRREILGAQCDLDAMPSVRWRALVSSLQPDEEVHG